MQPEMKKPRRGSDARASIDVNALKKDHEMNTTAISADRNDSGALVRVFVSKIGGVPTNVCDARELHGYLQNGDKFADWIKTRVEKYGFEENRDFAIASGNSEAKRGGHNRKDYHLSIDMAKELGMVENNDQGRKIRRYFIECEQRLRDIAPTVADTVLNTTIGTDGFRCLAAVVEGKARVLPAPARRQAKAKLWAQVHAAFSVRRAEDIPAEQLDAARNFVAAYALEGEWLPKAEEGDFIIKHADAHAICHLLHHAEWCVHRWNSGISAGLRELNRPLWSGAVEHFRQVELTGKSLELRMTEMIDHFRSLHGGLRPEEFFSRRIAA